MTLVERCEAHNLACHVQPLLASIVTGPFPRVSIQFIHNPHIGKFLDAVQQENLLLLLAHQLIIVYVAPASILGTEHCEYVVLAQDAVCRQIFVNAPYCP